MEEGMEQHGSEELSLEFESVLEGKEWGKMSLSLSVLRGLSFSW